MKSVEQVHLITLRDSPAPCQPMNYTQYQCTQKAALTRTPLEISLYGHEVSSM